MLRIGFLKPVKILLRWLILKYPRLWAVWLSHHSLFERILPTTPQESTLIWTFIKHYLDFFSKSHSLFSKFALWRHQRWGDHDSHICYQYSWTLFACPYYCCTKAETNICHLWYAHVIYWALFWASEPMLWRKKTYKSCQESRGSPGAPAHVFLS